MSWREVEVLVTGGGGFIGSHLVERLIEEGAHVRVFLRYTSRASLGNLDGLACGLPQDVVAGDLRDPDAVRSAMEGREVVFHLGALISIPYSYVHPRETVETNVLGTLNVLEAARTTTPVRVVHVSSSEVYGTAQTVPIGETHPLQGQSPYSASKIGADHVAESYHRAFGVPVTTVRPFNTYGPRQSARAVIPTIVTQALAGQQISLGSIAPTRDFTYVADTVAAMMLAGNTPGIDGRQINIGSGQEISIGDLAARIVELVGRDVLIVQEEERLRPTASEVERLLADASLAQSALGWHPQVTLENGLRETIDWVRQNLDAFRVGRYEA